MLSEQPPEQRPGGLHTDRATGGADPGPGESPARGEEGVSLVVRLEPYGPATALLVKRCTTMAEVKQIAAARFASAGADEGKLVLAKGGWVVDEGKTVAELEIKDMEFLSLGTKEDVDLAAATGKRRP